MGILVRLLKISQLLRHSRLSSMFNVQGSRLKSKKKKSSLIFLLFHLEFLNSLSNKDFFNTLLCQKSLFISANNQCYSGLT